MVIEADTVISYNTPSVDRMVGFRTDELIGTRVTNLIPPDDAARAVVFLADAARQAGSTPPG